MNTREDFATWLERQLANTPLDPTDLAARAGVSSAYISMMRRGHRRPSYNVVVAIVDALDVPDDMDDALEAAGYPARNWSSARKTGLLAARQLPAASEHVSSASQGTLDAAPPKNAQAIGADEAFRTVIVTLCDMLRSDDWRLRLQAGIELSKYVELLDVARTAMKRALDAEDKTVVRQAFKDALASGSKSDAVKGETSVSQRKQSSRHQDSPKRRKTG